MSSEPNDRRGRSWWKRIRSWGGAGFLPGTLPSEYPILIAMTGASVFLGVAREVLLIVFFGFSDITDTIHLYLLVTYSLGLLTDPIRLAGLNLFQTLPRRQVTASAAVVVVPFGVAVAVTTTLLVEREMQLGLLIGITATGVLLQLNQLTMAYKQRAGAVVPTQAVAVIPNVILIPGIVVVGLSGMSNPATGVLLCFFVVPVVQLFLLARIEGEQPEAAGPAEVGRPAPSRLHRVRLFAKHSVSAIGKQGFEIVVRTAMISLGEGFLTAFSLVTRVYASLRLVMVDTFIGARIRAWSTLASRAGQPKALRFILNPLFLLGLTSLGVLVALGPAVSGTRLAFALGYALFLVFGFPYDAAARILYFKSNVRMIPENLILQVALLEILFAALAFGIAHTAVEHVTLALLAWYVVKYAIQCRLIINTLSDQAAAVG